MTILSFLFYCPLGTPTYYPNVSYLSNTNYLAPAPQFFGNEKQEAALRQHYEDRIRGFNNLDTSFENQQSYYQSFSGHSQSFQDLYSTFRKAQLQPYVDSARHSEKNGDISAPVEYTSVVASSVTGNPVRTNLGDTHFSESLNVTNGSAESQLTNNNLKVGVDLNAQSARDAASAYVNNTEVYKATVQYSYGISGQLRYGGTTGLTQASISHPLFEHASVVLDKSWCVNSFVLAEASVKLGYQVSF